MLIQLWARDWSDSVIPVLLHMCFHIPYSCTYCDISPAPQTIPWHISQSTFVQHASWAQSGTLSLPSLCQRAHWQPTRHRSREKQKMGSLLPQLRHTEGLYLTPDLSIDSKVTWRERRKANGISNHSRLKFFGKQDKGRRIQFPPK